MAHLHEECGVFGVYGLPKAAETCALALYALQHRGQEGCGMAVQGRDGLRHHKALGQVKDVFTPPALDALPGELAVAHVRYSTTGGNELRNTQPMLANTRYGTLALVHNGNLSNAGPLRAELEEQGLIFQAGSDTEVIAYLMASQLRRTGGDLARAARACMERMEGAYSLVMLLGREMLALRDPKGMRPLVRGRVGGCPVFASESCAIASIGGQVEADVAPGELVRVREGRVEVLPPKAKDPGALCIFEHIYFARPDSTLDGQSVYQARLLAGELLAKTHPVQADLVVGVPDSGLIAAIGYARHAGIPYGEGLVKNRYIGRTFIEPTQTLRSAKVTLKLSPLRAAVAGKRLVLVDDSIVRGTTTGQIVSMLKKAGAREVHVRISSPPFLYPCYFGTDVASRDQLASVRFTHEQLTAHIGADSLGFLPLEALASIAPNSRLGFCAGCFQGQYPYPAPEDPR